MRSWLMEELRFRINDLWFTVFNLNANWMSHRWHGKHRTIMVHGSRFDVNVLEAFVTKMVFI